MESRLNKTQIMTMLTQTQENQRIHPRDCEEMLAPRIKLQKQCVCVGGARNQAILEQAPAKQGEIKDRQNQSYVKRTEKPEITQYVDKHPEMPGEMKLNRVGRKQKAEIMPEYPPKKSSRELTRQEGEHQEQKRKYACLRCRRLFSAPI